MSSVRSESWKPRTPNLAPQYALCSGMPLYASADPTLMIVPWFRGRIRRSATIVPHT